MSDASHMRDPKQIWQLAWDETSQALKTTASLSLSGSINVTIDHEDGDSIAIGDGAGSSRQAGVNTNLELKVNDSDANSKLTDIKTKLDTLKTEFDDTQTELVAIKTRLNTEMASSLVKEKFDNIAIGTRNSDGKPLTILYKLSSTTVATLTVTYTADGYVDTITKS